MHHRAVGQALERPQRVEEVRGAAPHEVGPARAAREQGIPREQVALHEDGEGVRGVARGVEDGHRPRAQFESPAALDLPRRPFELRGRVREHGGAGPLSQPAHPRQVVGVRVGVEEIGQAHVAGRQRFDESVDLVQTRVDGHGGAAGLVHDEITQAPVARSGKGVDGEGPGGTRECCHDVLPP